MNQSHTESGFERWNTFPEPPDPGIGPGISPAFLMDNRLIPLRTTETGEIVVAVSDPENTLALDSLAEALNRPLKIVVAPESLIRNALMTRSAETREKSRDLIRSDISDTVESTAGDGDLLVTDPGHPLVIRLVNSMITEALESRASDIHLEPEKHRLRVRYRIDGLLQDRDHPPGNLRDQVISRIKVLSRMDISNRLTPQDGSFSVSFSGRPIDIRVSAVPTPAGERLVLRLLGRLDVSTDLQSLGMPIPLIARIDEILSRPQGLFIVSGPTGSGKTTTLYAGLERINTRQRNTITLEDPVEYNLEGISQIQVGGSRKFGFAESLRSVLRQDPDIIMVGEIRDRETAGIALQSALTGHLMLTTIHTTDPMATVIRLLDLGVDPPLIAETLSAIMDQRLIRLNCPHCRPPETEPSQPSPGCPRCHETGYAGRTGLFRLLEIDDAIREAIRARNTGRVREIGLARCGDMLRTQAMTLIQTGHTTTAEMERVLKESS